MSGLNAKGTIVKKIVTLIIVYFYYGKLSLSLDTF